MKKTIFGIVFLLGLSCMVSCATNHQTDNIDSHFLQMSHETLDSIYSHYGIENEYLLRENFPLDDQFKASYLAEDDGSQGNPYSYLWPFSGTLSAVKAIYVASGDSTDLEILEARVLPGLDNYLDTVRTPEGYASYINTAPQSDRFYDDNIWLGIDFSDLYLHSNRKNYLDRAEKIWQFIESGFDELLNGGIYWCEQKKQSKNTCSNAPAAVFALKLFKATNDSSYLEKGKNLYQWTREMLQDTTDCLYFDKISLDGKVDSAKFAYNSGQMIQAASLLYKLTGEQEYLKQAQCTAENAFNHFFQGGEAKDEKGNFPLISKGNIWFTAVMTRGFKELYDIDHNSRYMDVLIRNLNNAWTTMRDPATGLFNEDWSGEEKCEKKWLLTQGAMTEMMAIAAEYESTK